MTLCHFIIDIQNITGQVAAGVLVRLTAGRVDVVPEVVLPSTVEATTDAAGRVAFDVVPNTLGLSQAYYQLSVVRPGKSTVTVYVVVPGMVQATLADCVVVRSLDELASTTKAGSVLQGPPGPRGMQGARGISVLSDANLVFSSPSDDVLYVDKLGADGVVRRATFPLAAGLPQVTAPDLASIEAYRTSATTWRDIPWGPESWPEPTLGGQIVRQVMDIDMPPGAVGPVPVIAHYHPNGSSHRVGDSGPVGVNVKAVALLMGFAFVTVEFRHPVTNVALGAPHNDVGLSLQFLRSLHQALGLRRDAIFVLGRSRGAGLALWQAMQADFANAQANSYAGRQSSGMRGLWTNNLQPTFSTQRFTELFVQPSDRAAMLAQHPDDVRWGSAVDDVATAPAVPPLVAFHDASYFNRLVTQAEAEGNLLHFPDGGRVVAEAVRAQGGVEDVINIDAEMGEAYQLADMVPWCQAILEGANCVEAWTIARTKALQAPAYWVPDNLSGVWQATDATGAPVVGGPIGAIIDGRFGVANRALGASAQGVHAGQPTANSKPTLQIIPATGHYAARFDSNDRLVAVTPHDGTPAFRAWTSAGEVTALSLLSGNNCFFGQPQMTGADMVLAILRPTGDFTETDLKGFRQFAKTLSGVSY